MSELDRLRGAFRTALALPEGAPVDQLEYRGIEAWDSLAHMTLVAQIEDTFDVMLDTDDCGGRGNLVVLDTRTGD